MRLRLLSVRRGFRGGGTTDGVRSLELRGVDWGEGGLDVMDEGCRCRGRERRRVSTLISSVCTEAVDDDVAGGRETWHPASLQSCGRTGSRGLGGADSGGCMEMAGMKGTDSCGGSGARTHTPSVCVSADAMSGSTGSGGSVGDGVLGGLGGWSMV